MDDILSDFLTETSENLDVIDVELVRFEQDPRDTEILGSIFRLVHTIKGTCGFLGLPRLEALAHAGETVMGKYRDGAKVTNDGVSLILEAIDRIKAIVAELEATHAEPEGSDADLISRLDALAEGDCSAEIAGPIPADRESGHAPTSGKVLLEELERAVGETSSPDDELEPAEREDAISQTSGSTSALMNDRTEDALAMKRKESSANQSIRVNVDTLEHLMTMVGELVLTRNQLLEMVKTLSDSEFKVPLQRLSNVTAELQEGVMKTRMQPIGNAWQKLPRIVRDLSKELEKKIDFEMRGAETELDRQVLELIRDPLIHMVRNSADHGLESPEVRRKIGKPESGKIRLTARHEGGYIVIEIADDGRGLDAEAIKEKLLESCSATREELEQLAEQQIHRFIFDAGFSTAKAVTNVSGRGVGMDVVRSNIELIGGTIDVKSVSGKGATFSIKIPLTLAIVSALIVEAGGQKFAIPQLSVVELVRTNGSAENRIELISDTPVLRLRNKLLPLVWLTKLLKLERCAAAEHRDCVERTVSRKSLEGNHFVLVVQVGDQSLGVIVDSIFDTEEIVVKPMSSRLRDITIFSGNTILGDGSVVMIIDPNSLVQGISSDAARQADDLEVAEDNGFQTGDQTTAMLIFKVGSDDQKAVPLSLITRLEEIEVSDIERSNGRHVVQYRGSLMPLIKLSEDYELTSDGPQPTLVFTDDHRSIGLAVDEIVDVVDDKLNIEMASTSDGVIGSAVIKGKATEIIDVGPYLKQVSEGWLEDSASQNSCRAGQILLIDDSSFFRNMLQPVLMSAGYEVTLAGSASEAFAMRESGASFDIIVSDIDMPKIDGIEFAESLRGDESWGSTPIIALSSHGSQDVIERSREAGFVDFVGKFDREGLLESLRDYSRELGIAA